MSILIRSFREEDSNRVNEIEKASFRSPWPLDFFDYLHEKNPELFLVAEINGQVVGFVIGEIRHIMLRGISLPSKLGHIMNLVVDEKWRNRGIGTILMGKIEEHKGPKGGQGYKWIG